MTKRSFKDFMRVADFGGPLAFAALAVLWAACLLQFNFEPLQLLRMIPGDRFFFLGAVGWTLIAMTAMLLGLSIWTIRERMVAYGLIRSVRRQLEARRLTATH